RTGGADCRGRTGRRGSYSAGGQPGSPAGTSWGPDRIASETAVLALAEADRRLAGCVGANSEEARMRVIASLVAALALLVGGALPAAAQSQPPPPPPPSRAMDRIDLVGLSTRQPTPDSPPNQVQFHA